MCNQSMEKGFQSAVLYPCQRALLPLLGNDRGPTATTCIQGKGKPSKALLLTSVFFDITFNFALYSMLGGSEDH